MPFLKRTTSGLKKRYEYDRSEFPFATGDWTAAAGISLSLSSNKLRVDITGGGNPKRVIHDDEDAEAEGMCHLRVDPSVGSGGNPGILVMAETVVHGSRDDIYATIPINFTGSRVLGDTDGAGGATTISSTGSINHNVSNPWAGTSWGDDADAAFYDFPRDATESGPQNYEPHSGKAGFVHFSTPADTLDIERFFSMSGRYISVSGLTSGWIAKVHSFGPIRGFQTIDTDTAGAPGTVTVDLLKAEFPFVALAIYESDGTTLVAVVEDCYGGDIYEIDNGPTQELTITNPGAESGDMTGWTDDGKATVASALGANPHTGSWSFLPNSPLVDESYSYQDIAIPGAWEGKVDAGAARAAFIYWLTSVGTAGCQSKGWVAFYDSTPSLISTSDTGELWVNASISYFPRGQTIAVPALTRYIRVFLWGARGTGQEKRLDDFELHLLGTGPDTPTVSVDPDAFFADLTGSTYSHDGGKAHAATQWQVDTSSAFESGMSTGFDSGFDALVYDATDTYVPGAAPASPQHRAAPLLASQAYWARARYQDENDEWSAWSAAQSFTTDAGSAPAQPTLSSTPSYDSVLLTSSAWVDGRDHTESEWEVDESGGDYSTPVAQSLNNPTDLESINLSGLSPSTAYIARVRHRADDGSFSAWSSNESFSTIADPASKPAQPTLTVADVHTRSADFTSSAYSYPGEPYLHAETRLEVSEDNTFPADATTFVYSFTPGSTAYSADALVTATLYYARVRYRANDGVWSAWSTTKSYTTDDDLMGATILKMTAPRHGAVVSGAAETITAEPTSVGGATFEIQLSSDDGETWAALANPSTLPYSWDTTGLTDGPNFVIRGRWTDGADWSAWEYRHVIVNNNADQNVFELPWGDADLDPDSMTKIWNQTLIDWYGSGTVIGEGAGLSSVGMSGLQITDWFEPNSVDVTVEILQGALGGFFRWQRYPEQCWSGAAIFSEDSVGLEDVFTGITCTYYQLPIWRYGNCMGRGRGPGYIEVQVWEEGSRELAVNIPVGNIHCVDLYPKDGEAGYCTKAPRYGLRFRVTTVRINGDGTRDLRLQAALYGMEIDTEAVGPWHWEHVITTSLNCGAVCLARKEITQANGAYSQFTNASAYVYEFSPCSAPEGFEEPLNPETCPPPIFDFTVFDDTDLVPIWGAVSAGEITDPSFSTWPQHDRPYLKLWDAGPEHEVDPIKGSSSIGSVAVSVIDKRVVACDERSGLLTSEIADADGFSAYIGRRGVLRERLSDGTYQIVQDGPIYSVRLRDTLVTFDFEVRGQRERERNVPIFTRNETVSVWPPGPVDGYGFIGTVFGSLGLYLINPAAVGRGVFAYNGGFGRVTVSGYTSQDYTPEMLEIGTPHTAVGLPTWALNYPDITVRWRYPGDGDDEWRYVRDMPGPPIGVVESPNFWIGSYTWDFWTGTVTPVDGPFAFRLTTIGIESPTDGATIEFQVLADVVSETWPFYYDGNAGEFLEAAYDGDYSPSDPNIGYDADAMAAFIAAAPNIRLRKTEAESDMRKWLEENIYGPLGWVPGLTEAGLIAPVSTALPDGTASLTTLDNALIVSAGWEQDGGRAVPVARFRFLREWRSPSDESAVVERGVYQGRGYSSGVAAASSDAGLVTQEVWIEVFARSSALLTTKALEYKPETIRSIGGELGEAITGGDLLSEFAARFAYDRLTEITNRYAFGPEWITLRARNTAAVRALTVGSWCKVDLDWLPNLATRYRGGQLLCLVLRRQKDPGLAWELTLLVGGSGNAGLVPPEFGSSGFSSGFDSGFHSLTVNADNSVSLNVDIDWFGWTSGFSSGFGDDSVSVRVQYALGATEPAAGSGAWTTFALVTSPSTVTTEPLPSGTTVWFRARSERAGYRPSAWSTTIATEIGTTTPVLYSLSVVISPAGTPTVLWTESPTALGLDIEYGVQGSGTPPLYGSSVEIDAKEPSVAGWDSGFSSGFRNISGVTRQYVLSGVTVDDGEQISIRVTPYTGFSGGSVTGTAGEPKTAAASQSGALVGSGFSSGFDTGHGS